MVQLWQARFTGGTRRSYKAQHYGYCTISISLTTEFALLHCWVVSIALLYASLCMTLLAFACSCYPQVKSGTSKMSSKNWMMQTSGTTITGAGSFTLPSTEHNQPTRSGSRPGQRCCSTCPGLLQTQQRTLSSAGSRSETLRSRGWTRTACRQVATG